MIDKHVETLVKKAGQTKSETEAAITSADVIYCDDKTLICVNVSEEEKLAVITQACGDIESSEKNLIKELKYRGVDTVVALSRRKGAAKIFPDKYKMDLVGHIYERKI